MSINLKQQYTWLIGVFTLLDWLYFKPSGWRKFIDNLGFENLEPGFCLVELTLQHFNNKPELFRIIIQGYLFLPILSILCIGLTGWWLKHDTLYFALTGGLSFGLIASVTFGMVVSTAIGIAGNPLFTLAGYFLFSNQDINEYSVAALCFSLGTVSNMIIYLLEKNRKDLVYGEILLGVIVGIIGFFVIFGIPTWLANYTNYTTLLIMVLVLIAIVVIIPSSYTSCCRRKCDCHDKYSWLFWISLFVLIGFFGALTFTSAGGLTGFAKGIIYAFVLAACFALPYAVVHKIFENNEKKEANSGTSVPGTIASVLVIGIIIAYAGTLLTSIENDENIIFLPQPNYFIIIGLLACIAGIFFSDWSRFILFPLESLWNSIIYILDKNDSKLRKILYNSAFWDELQWLPLQSLDKHLSLLETDTAIQVIDKHLENKNQHWIRDSLIIKRDSQLLMPYQSIDDIKSCHETLNNITINAEWLQDFSQVSAALESALKLQTVYDQLSALQNVLNTLSSIIDKSKNAKFPYTQYETIANKWHELVLQHKNELDKFTHSIIKSPYVIGNPLNSQQQSFVGRTELASRLKTLLFERQVSVFLYGQYRIGKTSLLKNLIALFGNPQHVVALFIDLQGAIAIGGSTKNFFEYIAYNMKNSANREYRLNFPDFTVQNNPYADFNRWLDEIQNNILEGKTLILLLDELAKLNKTVACTDNDFDYERLDNVLRHWIQHRSNFKLIISSQRQVDCELWPSVANSINVVPISYLTEKEAKQLVEAPVKDFPLQYDATATRKVLTLTHGHPALIQLLCDNVIYLKNDQRIEERFFAIVNDIEQAAQKTLETGMSVFFTNADQIDEIGKTILRYIAQQNRPISMQTLQLQQFDAIEKSIELSLQLALLEETKEGYQFQVELIRRYFAQLT